MVKEFNTALRAVDEGDDAYTLKFKVDGRELTAYKPSDGQLAMLMVAVSKHVSQSTQIAGVIDFFVSVMDNTSHGYIVDRLMDREDMFGIEEVQAIMEWMVEEWTGRPSQPLSVSTQ